MGRGVKMTLIGTGVRTPFVLHGLAERERELGLTEVVMHDADHERLEIMSALGAHLCSQWGATFTVRAERDARAALAGSRFVFTAIRVGQERARALDEQLPLKYGVLGQETTGPGGFAMAMRTIPAMLGYARIVTEVAPDALIVNFTNPVGLIVQALSDHASARVVGVCDGPIGMKQSVAEFLGVPADEVHADYFGLNHAGWIHRVLVEGRDRLPEILDRYEAAAATGRVVAAVRSRARSRARDAADGVPLLLLLPPASGGEHRGLRQLPGEPPSRRSVSAGTPSSGSRRAASRCSASRTGLWSPSASRWAARTAS